MDFLVNQNVLKSDLKKSRIWVNVTKLCAIPDVELPTSLVCQWHLEKKDNFWQFFEKNVKFLAIFGQSNGNLPEGQLQRTLLYHCQIWAQMIKILDFFSSNFSTSQNVLKSDLTKVPNLSHFGPKSVHPALFYRVQRDATRYFLSGETTH